MAEPAQDQGAASAPLAGDSGGRIKGRMRRFTLGAYPALTVAAARQQALAAKAAIVGGRDPSAERRNLALEV